MQIYYSKYIHELHEHFFFISGELIIAWEGLSFLRKPPFILNHYTMAWYPAHICGMLHFVCFWEFHNITHLFQVFFRLGEFREIYKKHQLKKIIKKENWHDNINISSFSAILIWKQCTKIWILSHSVLSDCTLGQFFFYIPITYLVHIKGGSTGPIQKLE